MRCELPDFKRCCFCIPLRKGLLAWGYLKLGLMMLIWIPMGTVVYFSLAFGGYIDANVLVVALLLVVDFAFNISFLIAAHTKDFKLFKVYYYYIMAFTVIVTIIILAFMGLSIASVIRRSLQHHVPDELLIGLALAFFNVVIQMYIMLLVRSEIRKLENDTQFEFVNNESQEQIKSTLRMVDVHLPEKDSIPNNAITVDS